MNELIKQEFDKLTPEQKAKFQQLVSWQTQHNKGQRILIDTAYWEILKMVKVSED